MKGYRADVIEMLPNINVLDNEYCKMMVVTDKHSTPTPDIVMYGDDAVRSFTTDFNGKVQKLTENSVK